LSKFTYRPFTLEGNFAFAAGVQEMLLQSYAGFIELMPAIPANWTGASYENLRAEGAFLVSAKKTKGKLTEVAILAETGGNTRVKLSLDQWRVASARGVTVSAAGEDFVQLNAQPGGRVVLIRK
jgi:alpha-L-fucosidase 2